MASHKEGKRDLCIMRVTRVDSTGAAVTGATGLYVSDTLGQISLTNVFEETKGVSLRNGCGLVQVQVPTTEAPVGTNAELTVNMLEPDLIELFGAGTLIVDTDNIGYQQRAAAAAAPDGCCLEWWTRAQDGASQSEMGGNPAWWHNVIPLAKGRITKDEDKEGPSAVTISITGTENSGMAATGPVTADPWPAAVTGSHARWLEGLAALESAVTGYQTLA